MKIFNWKNEWFPLLTLIGALIVTGLWYDDLPAKVPSHWNIQGVIDGYTTPQGHVWMFVGLMVFMYALFTLIPHLEPRKDNMQKSLKFLNVVKNFMMGFFFALYTLITYMAVSGSPIAIEKFISVGIGAMFIAIGKYMQDIKSNYFMGIRTPWTLHSDSIWHKTHKLGSTMFMLAGALFVISPILPTPWNFVIPMTGIILAGITPIIYSYLLFRKE